MKIIAHATYTSLAVAGLSIDRRRPDLDEGHFSFIVYNIDALQFAQALEDCLSQRQDFDTYYNVQEIVLKSSRHYDTIRIVRECATISITRGNLKVLFYGSVDVLRGLPKIIRKAVKKRDSEGEKE